MTKYRVDQLRELQEAVERMQQVWKDAPPVRDPHREDVVERTSGRGLHDPLPHRQVFSKALDRNLEIGGLRPETARHLGRSADGKGKVVPPLVKAEPRADEWLFPPKDLEVERRRMGRARRKKRRRKGRGDVTVEQMEREEVYEEGVEYVEETALPAYEHPTTSGAVADMKARVPDVPLSDEPPPAPLDEEPTLDERTHASFRYEPGETAYDAWLEEHAGGAEIVSGDGATFVDPHRTRTFVVGGGARGAGVRPRGEEEKEDEA